MRAAVMLDGERPVFGSFAEPQATDGLLVVTMCAAALSGLDTRVARRLHYFKMPDGPFVIGKDGVARGSDGRRLYFNANAPAGPFGSMAERTLIDPRFAFPVPDNVADDVAAAMGNAGLAAWLPLSWRAKLRPGETVLILGATGIAGLIAVTAARRLGAGRIVAAGRNRDALQRARRLGADAIVDLAATTDLAAAYREAAGGEVDVVVDYVFGPPSEAALECSRILAAWSTSAAWRGPPSKCPARRCAGPAATSWVLPTITRRSRSRRRPMRSCAGFMRRAKSRSISSRGRSPTSAPPGTRKWRAPAAGRF